jgi:hypothetical protein
MIDKIWIGIVIVLTVYSFIFIWIDHHKDKGNGDVYNAY